MRCAAFILLLTLLSHSIMASEAHPRLFVDSTRINEIRLAAGVADSRHQRALAAMRARVDSAGIDTADGIYGDNLSYSRAYLAARPHFSASS